jgi:mono/diheme cytochrome c family protein
MCRPIFSVLLSFVFLISPVWAADDDGPQGDPENGKVLFESDLGCHVCHGADAMGSIGPNIRETITIEQVYHALQNFPDMMNWQYNNPELFEDEALFDIISYLQSLPREAVAE